MRRPHAVLAGLAALAFAFALPVPGLHAQQLSADGIFSRAKGVWRARTDVPFVGFALRERYTWRDRIHDNWWQASYRTVDGALAMQRQVVPEAEAARLRGLPIHLSVRIHGGFAHADSLETNADADAFPILAPLIAPDTSFGLRPHEAHAALSAESRRDGASAATAAAPLAEPFPAASADPTALRELVRIEATSRDYAIALAGNESLNGTATYHLSLTPLRDPRVYRLRELWVDADDFRTVRLAMRGLFEGKPYEDALWLVSYVNIEGRDYVQQIRTADTLRFGLDRFVDGLQYDFVQYAFPASIPDLTFRQFM